jgi:hypothetical protein
MNYNEKHIKKCITIQKYSMRFIVKKNLIIPSSEYQTKKWRKSQKWYKSGKINETWNINIKYIYNN